MGPLRSTCIQPHLEGGGESVLHGEDVLGGSDPRHDVLALRVDQVLAVQQVLPRVWFAPLPGGVRFGQLHRPHWLCHQLNRVLSTTNVRSTAHVRSSLLTLC
jgi:hypothetical protein